MLRSTILGFAAASALAVPFSGFAATPREKASLPQSEQRFLVEAAEGNTAEMKLGQLAEQQSSNDAIRQLGMTLQDDHRQANESLEKVFTEQNIAFPHAVSKKHLATFTKLNDVAKEKFDETFLDEVVKDHKADMKAYKDWQKKAVQPGVKEYVTQTLPKIQNHLETAQRIQREMRFKGAS